MKSDRQLQRDKMRDLGFVLKQVFVHSDDLERFREFVESLPNRDKAKEMPRGGFYKNEKTM